MMPSTVDNPVPPIRRLSARLLFGIGAAHPEWLLKYLCALPRGFLDRVRRSAFRRTLELAASRSAFYRQKFSELGIDISNAQAPEELGQFYVSDEELRREPEAFLCGKPELAIESSGTTGHVIRMFLNQRELNASAKQGVLLKAIYRISEEDRILSTFDHGFCLDGLLVERGLPYWNVFGMCVGRADPTEIYRRMPDYRFNVIMSGTPWLARFTEVAEAQGRPYPLKLLVGGGGGGIPGRTRAWIENFWEAPLCMTYASTESATALGFECLRREGYHLNEFNFFVEILNPDNEGYGEIVITTLNRGVLPLIRYRTRDVARFISERCPCGLPFRRLSPLRGRLDEIVASVWGNVHPDFFEKILGAVPGITDDWQVALQEKEGKQTFQFRLESRDGIADESKATSFILRRIESEHRLAWQAYTQKLAGIEFVFHPKGTLRKGRKLLRLTDERKTAKTGSYDQ